ncbi:hypothetical protein J6590_004385 [Homalodisca vitripennis]|nr:hypothetical protein J6590_004385 [Homalodisca vitripennis]
MSSVGRRNVPIMSKPCPDNQRPINGNCRVSLIVLIASARAWANTPLVFGLYIVITSSLILSTSVDTSLDDEVSDVGMCLS